MELVDLFAGSVLLIINFMSRGLASSVFGTVR
jgi:16S rRNA G966 N2-methylase RsmD